MSIEPDSPHAVAQTTSKDDTFAFTPPESDKPPARMDSPLKRSTGYGPLIGAVAVFLALLGLIYSACVRETGWPFIYPLDDAYIHLAVARNFAQEGVWGVTSGVFSSAASSISWPLQLAGLMKVVGPVEILPLLLNTVYGIVVLAVAFAIFRHRGMSGRPVFWLLALIVLATPLPLLVLQGMEHTMHIAVALGFGYVAACVLGEKRGSRSQIILLCLLAAILTATRYEGMFMVAATAFVALFQRRFALIGLLAVSAAAPLGIFGLYAVAHGSHWLPNPILVKSDLRNVRSLSHFILLMSTLKLNQLATMTAVVFPLIAALLGVVVDSAGARRLNAVDRYFVLIVALTTGMHLFGAKIGWFMRYEAYLIPLNIVAAGVAWRYGLEKFRLAAPDSNLERSAVAQVSVLLLCLVLAAPYFYRLGNGLFQAPTASRNIHDQQVQMAQFIKEFYDGQPIVINDLGAIAWKTTARPVDMGGLATLEIARSMAKNKFTSDVLNDIAREQGARVAIVFNTPIWMPDPRPPVGWIHVGSWTISHNVICGEDTVHFYALDSQAAVELDRHLRAFAPQLPQDVTVKYTGIDGVGAN